MILLWLGETRLVDVDFGEDCNLKNGQTLCPLVLFSETDLTNVGRVSKPPMTPWS